MVDKIIVSLLIIAGVTFSSLALTVWKDQEAIVLKQASPAVELDSKNLTQESVSKEDDIIFSWEIIDLTDDVGQNYFVNYRIKREQFRQETKDMLQLLLESDIQQTREQAQKRWLVLSNKIALEKEIENIVKMRGFRDVVSEVNTNSVVVTILAKELKPHEIELIKRIVSDISNFSKVKIEVGVRS